MREKRPVNEVRVRKTRASIIPQSGAVRLSDFRNALSLAQTDITKILDAE
jgi:hypothetical protein